MILQVGPFTIDPLRRELLHHGHRVELTPKPFECLLYMARNPGRIIDKDELLNVVWPNVLVCQANLTQTVFLLRKVLEIFGSHGYIVTVPGKGYQFAAHVRCMNVEDRSRQTNGKHTENQVDARHLTPHLSSVNQMLNHRTVESVERAIRIAQRTIRRKPGCASAHVDLANAYCLLITLGAVAPREVIPEIKDAALKALEIDPGAYAAYGPLGFVRCHCDNDWALAEQDFQRVVDGPTDSTIAHHWYGEFLTAHGRFDESLAILRRAQEITPRSLLIRTDVAQTLFFAREYKDCEGHLKTTMEMDPVFPRTNVLLGCTYRQQGRVREAVGVFERISQLRTNVTALAMLGDAYALAGKRDRALDVVRRISTLSTTRYASPYAQGFVFAGLGEYPQAFRLFEQASLEKDYWLLWLKVTPNLDPLRQEPKFLHLLQHTKLSA
jgi:DNA-binding winged helix-turn-helix (wHTH) protein